MWSLQAMLQINEHDCFIIILEFQGFCKCLDLSDFVRVTVLAKNRHSHLVVTLNGFSTEFLEDVQYHDVY